MDIKNAEIWVGVISSIAAAGGFAWKFAIKPLITKIQNIRLFISQLGLLVPVLQEIHDEFKKDGKPTLPRIFALFEKELIFSHNRYRLLIQALRVAVFEADSNGKILWVSDEWCRMTGLLPHESFGNGWINGIAPSDRKVIFEEWSLAISQQRESVSTPFKVGDEEILVYWHTYPIADARSEIVGYIGVLYKYEPESTIP